MVVFIAHIELHIYIYIILYDHTYCWFTTLGWHFFGETNSLYKEDERF